MLRLSLGFVLLLSAIQVSASVTFQNDREGKSYYQSKAYTKEISRAHKLVPEARIKASFENVLSETNPQKICSFEIIEKFENELLKENSKFRELRGGLYSLRENNLIDDTVLKILIDAKDLKDQQLFLPKDGEALVIPPEEYVKEITPIIGRFDTSLCLEESFKNLYSEILKVYKKTTSKNLEALFVKAYQEKRIDFKTYEILEKARLKELHLSRQTLQAYYKKISNLRNQYPVMMNESSDFVATKAPKQKFSYRQRLYENYSEMQIILMGNIIKKLRARLESPRAEILIFDKEEDFETIVLGPMERFRLAVKLLRKEMAELKLNTFFDGRSPDYLDLITASFEIGVIAGEEVDEMATLQEFWNPKKTFWEKARVWVQLLSSTATIVIPPPFGFIPALAVVIIEATVTPGTNTNDLDPTSLF